MNRTCLGWMLLAGLTGCAWADGQFQKVGAIDTNLPAQDIRKVVLRNAVGSLEIEAGTEDILRLRVDVSYRGGLPELGRAVTREDFLIRHSQEVLTLQNAFSGTRQAEDWKMDIRLTGPPRLDLEAQCDKGNCQVYGWEGDLEIRVGVGNIEVTSEHVAGIRARSGVGDVRLEILEEGPSSDSRCETGTGNVVIRLPGAFSGEVSLESGVGETRVHDTPGVTVKETVSSSSAWGKVGTAEVKMAGISGVGNVDFAIR